MIAPEGQGAVRPDEGIPNLPQFLCLMLKTRERVNPPQIFLLHRSAKSLAILQVRKRRLRISVDNRLSQVAVRYTP